MNRIFGFWYRRRENFQKLRAAANCAGEEFERKSYEELLICSEEDFSYPKQSLEGYEISFSGTATVEKNGDLLYSLNLYSEMPTILGVKPGYHFHKRRDGSVYY